MSRIAFMAAMMCLPVLGCTVGPEYERPEIKAPAAFVSQDVLDALQKEKTDAPLATDWWKGFHDPMLNALIADGLTHNYAIAAAHARLREAEANIQLADSGDNLSITADASGDAENRHRLNGGNHTNASELLGTVGAVIPVDLSGGTRRRIEAARANLESTQEALKSVVLGVSADIATEYLRLRGNQRQLELLRASVALQEKTHSIVRTRYEAGLSPELDLQRAITTVENLRARIPQLEESLQNARNRLAVLTGDFPGSLETTLQEPGEIPTYHAAMPNLLPLDVLNSRPDVQQAEAELKQAIANIGVAEAQFYPAFEVAGDISIGRVATTGMATTNLLISAISGVIDQIILDDGSRDANLAIAKAQAEEALAHYEAILRSATEEVEASLTAIRASQNRQSSLQKAVDASNRSFAQAETLYQQGLISFLDVVDAQRVLADAQQTLAAEKTNYAVQIARLFQKLGAEIRLKEE